LSGLHRAFGKFGSRSIPKEDFLNFLKTERKFSNKQKMNKEKEKWIILVVLSNLGLFFYIDKEILEHFSPYQVGALRVLISGVLLSPIAILNEEISLKAIEMAFISSFCGNFIPMFLFPIAETKVSSSIAGIMNSMMPFYNYCRSLFWKTKTTRNKF
jgi:drug/metabolite transporter (DMT)-like permease